MLDLHYIDWHKELEAIVSDIYGVTVSEFCKDRKVKSNALSQFYKLDFSPLETFEEIDSNF